MVKISYQVTQHSSAAVAGRAETAAVAGRAETAAVAGRLNLLTFRLSCGSLYDTIVVIYANFSLCLLNANFQVCKGISWI